MHYLVVINLISLIIFKIDKVLAINKKRRIPERILIILSLIGGPFGSFFGMILFHHKTKKLKFKIMIPVLSIVWIIIILKIRGII